MDARTGVEERQGAAQGHLALLAVQVLFGLFPLFGKWAFAGFTPPAIAAWRIAFGAVALGGLAFVRHRRAAVPPQRDLGRIFLCATLGITANQVLYLEGLRRAPAVNATLLMLLIPVATFAIAVLLRQERWSARRGAGLLLALAGSTQLLLQRDLSLGPEYVTGNLLLAANAVAYSFYLVLSRDLARRHPPLALIAWMYASSAWAVPFLASSGKWIPEGAETRVWLSLAFILAGPTVLAYLLNVFALSRVAASTTAAWILLQPLITGAGSFFLLGERLTPPIWIAAATNSAGIWLVSRSPRRAAAAPSTGGRTTQGTPPAG